MNCELKQKVFGRLASSPSSKLCLALMRYMWQLIICVNSNMSNYNVIYSEHIFLTSSDNHASVESRRKASFWTPISTIRSWQGTILILQTSSVKAPTWRMAASQRVRDNSSGTAFRKSIWDAYVIEKDFPATSSVHKARPIKSKHD